MFRTLLVILLVAGLSCWINQLEMAHGDPIDTTDWVHTTDGWEPITVLSSQAANGPPLHPLTVAGLQLCGSLLVLTAFPAKLPQA
jgi:hypothetical protein